MQPEAPNLSINLGKSTKQDPTSLFVKWAVNTGKIIIVGVELLTLGALGYRFVIDRQIVDLHDQIRNERLLVGTQAGKEVLYTNLQSRLNNIQGLESETQKKMSFVRELLRILNTNEYISSNLSISPTSITIEGQTYSIFTLNALTEKLKEDPNVISISIDEITSLDQGVRFKLTTQLKQ